MNPTQWVFEAESLAIAEEDRVEEMRSILDIFKGTLIRLLGLNVMPVEDINGGLRAPEEGEIIPLSIWTASEGLLKEALERNKDLTEQAKIEEELGSANSSLDEMSIDELDALMDDMGDIVFDDEGGNDRLLKSLAWESDEAKTMRNQLIQVVDSVPEANKRPKVRIMQLDDDDDWGEPDLKNPTKVVVESIDEEI